MRIGRLALLLLLANALILGYRWWSSRPLYPSTQPADALVLQPADLPPAFRPDPGATRTIAENPYADDTEYFRGGYHVEYATRDDPRWGNTRVISTTFVMDRRGAERVFRGYRNRLRYRGEPLNLPPLGQESQLVLARDERSAPVVIIAAVRAENVLITLTVLSDRELDPAEVHGWARLLVQRVQAG